MERYTIKVVSTAAQGKSDFGYWNYVCSVEEAEVEE